MGRVVPNVIEWGHPNIINYYNLLSAGRAEIVWVALEHAQVFTSPEGNI